MYIYLCLNPDDIVTDIMVTEYQMIHTERIQYDVADYSLIGKLYDRELGTFTDVPVYVSNEVTKLCFRQRFTLSELTSIYNSRGDDIVIDIFLDNLAVSEYVDLNDPDTQNGIGYLYNTGHLTYERMLEILE